MQLPERLREFQRTEVVGCDAHSIGLYLEEKEAFGVVPNQVVNMGFDAGISTALILYQMDKAQLYGLWKVNGRQIADGEQVPFLDQLFVFTLPSLPMQGSHRMWY